MISLRPLRLRGASMACDGKELRIVNRIALSLGTLAVSVVAVPAAMAADAPSTEPSMAQLQEQVRQLKAKVEQLENKQATVDRQVVDQTVERVLRDADHR